MTIRLGAPLAVALFCSAPAFAAASAPSTAAPAGEAPAAEAAPAKTKKVCRMETATGSVMPKRVCRTVAQMEEDERNAERFRDRQNRMGASAR